MTNYAIQNPRSGRYLVILPVSPRPDLPTVVWTPDEDQASAWPSMTSAIMAGTEALGLSGTWEAVPVAR